MGRRRCGIGLAIALLVATFWTEQLALSIQNSPQCGGVEGEPAHQGVVILGTPLGHEDCQGTVGTHCGGAQRFVRTDPFSSGCPIRLGIVVALRQCPSELRSSCGSGFGQAVRASSRCRVVEVFVLLKMQLHFRSAWVVLACAAP